MAPELLLGHQPYNHKVDIWALGIIAFKLLNGDKVHPYYKPRSQRDLTRVFERKHPHAYYDVEKYFVRNNSFS